MFKRILLTSLVLALTFITSAIPANAEFYTTDSDCIHPFVDSIGHPKEESICFMYSQGVIQGDVIVPGQQSRNFNPDELVSRAENTKIAVLSFGHNIISMPEYAFSDTPAGEWFFRYVTFARWRGFVQGDHGLNQFRPHDLVTRAEAMVTIANLAGVHDYNTDSVSQFIDVNPNDWFAYAVAFAYDFDIAPNYGNRFNPHEFITRAEASEIAEGALKALR